MIFALLITKRFDDAMGEPTNAGKSPFAAPRENMVKTGYSPKGATSIFDPFGRLALADGPDSFGFGNGKNNGIMEPGEQTPVQKNYNKAMAESKAGKNAQGTGNTPEGGAKGTNNPAVKNRKEIGKEAHRQLEHEGLDRWSPEQNIKLPDGTLLRKDGIGRINPNEVRIIKPDTPSGRIAAAKRATLMRKFGYDPTIDYYDPTNVAFQPGSSTYIGPK